MSDHELSREGLQSAESPAALSNVAGARIPRCVLSLGVILDCGLSIPMETTENTRWQHTKLRMAGCVW